VLVSIVVDDLHAVDAAYLRSYGPEAIMADPAMAQPGFKCSAGWTLVLASP